MTEPDVLPMVSSHFCNLCNLFTFPGQIMVCDLEVVTLIAEMLLLLSRSIPIDKCLVRNEQCRAIETK